MHKRSAWSERRGNNYLRAVVLDGDFMEVSVQEKFPGVVFLSVIRPEGNSKAKILVLCLENILGLINSRHQKIIVGSRFSIIGGKVQLNKFSLDKINQLSNGTYEMDPVEAEVLRYFFDKHMNSELTKALK